MMTYPDSLPCPSRESYNFMPQPATSRLPAFKGRPRHELLDIYAPDVASLSLTFTEAQFAEWQAFWAATNYGENWWLMDLYLDGTEQELEVHAMGAWSSTLKRNGIRSVSLSVEAIAPWVDDRQPPKFTRDPSTGEVTLSGLTGAFLYELNDDGTYVQHVAADAPGGTYTIVGTTLSDSVEVWHDGPGVVLS